MSDCIPPATDSPPIDTSHWPLLLKNYHLLNVRTGHYTPLPYGSSPYRRSIQDLLKYGFVSVDKPANPSSHEVVSWIRKILKTAKVGHGGTLDPSVTGLLLVFLNHATKLVKQKQKESKKYIAVAKLHGVPRNGEADIRSALSKLTGALFQRPPVIAAVKRQLRVRSVHAVNFFEYDQENNLVLFDVECEAGTYIRTLCVHLGLILGVGAHMEDLRRTKTGFFTENDGLVTLQDILDAQYLYEHDKDESYLRNIIQPLEKLLVNLPRLVVKDSTVNALCYGAKLMVVGILRFESNIETGDEVVLMTTKGEAIALAIAQMTSAVMATVDHGVAAKVKRVLMDRDTYSVRWGYGPRALEKKKLISSGLLDKHGKPNEKTPESWINYKGYLPQLTGDNIRNPSLAPPSPPECANAEPSETSPLEAPEPPADETRKAKRTKKDKDRKSHKKHKTS